MYRSLNQHSNLLARTGKRRCEFSHLVLGEIEFVPKILEISPRRLNENMHVFALQFSQMGELLLKL